MIRNKKINIDIYKLYNYDTDVSLNVHDSKFFVLFLFFYSNYDIHD